MSTLTSSAPAADAGASAAPLHSHWMALMQQADPFFADDYLVFDLETSGFDASRDLILEVGLCSVRGRRAEDTQLVVLDWPGCPEVDQAWLRWRIANTVARARADGRDLPLSYDRLRTHPRRVPPLAGLRLVYGWLGDAFGRGELVVGHNAKAFDARFLKSHFRDWLGVDDFGFPPGRLYDTGILEKGAQLGVMPWGGETFDHYCERVDAKRVAKLRWNLNDHCVAKYDLLRRHNITDPRPHQADFDALLNHYLFEELRQGCRRGV